MPSDRDAQIARSALRSCVARDASQSQVYCCRRVLFQQFVDHPKESNVGSTPILGANTVEGGLKMGTGGFRDRVIGARIDYVSSVSF